MIHLFKSTTTKNDLIQYNGDYILDTITSAAIINEELNGVYTLDLRLSIVDSFEQKGYDMVTESSLIKINDEYGDEYFRIAQVRKNKRYIEVFARHITISDTLTMWLEDVRPENRNGNSAINYIFANATTPSWFNVSSDISNQATAYYINKTVYEALGTVDNSFLNRWGGEIYRRGFNIQINDRVGSDKGVSIRSRKNLTGLEVSTNENELTTRIYPKGWDGISLDEKKVDSPLINSYSRIFSREKKFEDVRVNDEDYKDGFETLQLAQDELRRRSKELFEKSFVDIITASYRVNFVELAKTEEYKNYSIVEKTWLGDTVHVFDEDLNIDIDVRVIGRTYDCLKKERISTDLSNKNTKTKPPTLADVMKELENTPSSDEILQKAKENATALINAGMKDSFVVVRRNEILIMDTQDITTATKVWRMNSGGIGYSNTGYYGEYGLAMTMDGSIVADFITTGVLNAELVKTGVLSSVDGRFNVDMATGEFSISSDNGNNGFKIDDDGLSVFRNRVRSLLFNDGVMKVYNSTTGAYMGFFGTDGNDLRASLIGTNTFSIVAGDEGIKMLEAKYDREQRYGNAMLDICGGVVFTQRPNQDVGFNAILLGNDDRDDKYGFHNMSIACHNSLGFQDNLGLTNMFFRIREGDIVTKGTVYQNAEVPPRSFLLSTNKRNKYYSGIGKNDIIESILTLETEVVINSDNYTSLKLIPIDDEIVSTKIDGVPHVDQSSVVAGLVETVKKQQEQINKLMQLIEQSAIIN